MVFFKIYKLTLQNFGEPMHLYAFPTEWNYALSFDYARHYGDGAEANMQSNT